MESNNNYYDEETLKRLQEFEAQQTEEVDTGAEAPTITPEERAVDSLIDMVNGSGNGNNSRGNQQEQRDLLIATIELQIGLNFFKTDNKTAYATLPSGIHAEIGSDDFDKYILSVAYGFEPRYFIGQQAIDSISQFIEYNVLTSTEPVYPTHQIFKRVGHDPTDNSVWILADLNPIRYIHVTTGAITEESTCPIKIILNESSLPLPTVAPKGNFELINKYLNVEKNQRPLVHNFIVESYCARNEFSIFQLLAQHNTGKTTLIKLLYKLIDPNINDIGQPTDIWSNMVNANSTHLLNYDNMEKENMEKDFPSMMSKIATETSFKKRKLHSNKKMVSFKTKNPQIYASIYQVISAVDVHSRSIVINPPTLKDSFNKLNQEFWDAFEVDYSTIFNGILSAIQHVLTHRDSVSTKNLERMTEAHHIGRTLDSFEGLTWDISYDEALAENKQIINESIIDSHPMAQLLIILMEENNNVTINKTPTEWLEFLHSNKYSSNTPGVESEKQIIQQTIPKNSKAMATQFTNVVTPLRNQGYILEKGRDNKRRFWKLSSIKESVTPVTPVTDTRETTPSDSDACDTSDALMNTQTPLIRNDFSKTFPEIAKKEIHE